MGLGIDIRASHAGNREECRQKLLAFFAQEPSVIPGSFLSTTAYNNTVTASLFFAEEDIYFTFEGERGLGISAKTNGAGPGYHAYLVDLLERLRNACGLAWANDDVEDDTGYWHGRDFDDLRQAMAGWLESLADALAENHMGENASGLAICMGTERVPESDEHYAAHLLGWLEREFFLSIVENGATEKDCEEFFIWWDEYVSPEFYLKCARSMMWCDCNWLSPVTSQEKSLFTAMLLCLESAWDNDPSLTFPVPEWREIADLSSSREIAEELERRFPEAVPEPGRIGYLRGNVRVNLGNGWRMTIPGAMHKELEGEDNTVQVFWDDERTLRVSRYAVSGERISAESLLDTITENVPAVSSFGLENQGEVLARISHEPQRDDDGTEYFASFFFAAVDAGRVLYISAFYDEEEGKVWAERMFATCSWQRD